jgi:hypothetical protein
VPTGGNRTAKMILMGSVAVMAILQRRAKHSATPRATEGIGSWILPGEIIAR